MMIKDFGELNTHKPLWINQRPMSLKIKMLHCENQHPNMFQTIF